ncbi:MAG: MoaD/ThiS family protein [Myxococcota bacterium]
MPTVHVPPPYRGPTQGAAEIQVEASTVLGCLEAVETLHPGFRGQVLDASGRPHRFVKLFVNGELIDGEVLTARVSEGDRVEVLAAIAGGSEPARCGPLPRRGASLYNHQFDHQSRPRRDS